MSIAANYLAEAASDALRRDRAVGVGSLAILSAELADADTLAALETRSRAGLIITARRAAVLNLANQIAAAAPDPEPVWVDRPDWLDLTGSRAVADPVLDLATPFKGPFRTRALDGDAASARAAIALVKHAGLIPAVYAVPLAGAEIAVTCPPKPRLPCRRLWPASTFPAAPGCRWPTPKIRRSLPSAPMMAARSIWHW